MGVWKYYTAINGYAMLQGNASEHSERAAYNDQQRTRLRHGETERT